MRNTDREKVDTIGSGNILLCFFSWDSSSTKINHYIQYGEPSSNIHSGGDLNLFTDNFLRNIWCEAMLKLNNCLWFSTRQQFLLIQRRTRMVRPLFLTLFKSTHNCRSDTLPCTAETKASLNTQSVQLHVFVSKVCINVHISAWQTMCPRLYLRFGQANCEIPRFLSLFSVCLLSVPSIFLLVISY